MAKSLKGFRPSQSSKPSSVPLPGLQVPPTIWKLSLISLFSPPYISRLAYFQSIAPLFLYYNLIVTSLIVWFVAWFIFWGIFNGFFRWQFKTFGKLRYVLNWLFFVFTSIPLYFLLTNPLFDVHQLSYAFFTCMTLGVILSQIPVFYKKIEKGRFFLEFHEGNILLQQLFVIAGVYFLSQYYGPNYKDSYFGIVFSLTHLPVIFLRWAKLRYLYLVFTFIAGIAFSFLIRNFQYGVFVSFIVHYCTYIFLIRYLKNEDLV